MRFILFTTKKRITLREKTEFKRGAFMEKYDGSTVNPTMLDNALVVMANSLARKQTKWSVREVKLFLTALSQIKTRDKDNWVTLNKSDIIKKLEMDARNTNKLRGLFKDVATKSWVQFDGENEEEWHDGFLITMAKSTRNTVSVQFAKDYLPLLDQLETRFTWFYLDNIAHFNSKHAISLYQFLRSWYDKDYMITHKKVSLKDLKQLFELDENSYMVKRTDKKTGRVNIVFDVYNFEKKVLNKAIEEINADPVKSGMFVSYEKLKSHGTTGHVLGYDFAFSLIKQDGTRRYDKEDKQDKKTPVNDGDHFDKTSQKVKKVFYGID